MALTENALYRRAFMWTTVLLEVLYWNECDTSSIAPQWTENVNYV